MYKSIIFDIGGVLVDFDPKAYLVDRLCNAEMEEKVYDLTFGSEEWQLLDAGKLSRYDGNQRMLEHARAEGCAFEVQGVLDDWMHILRPRLRMLELVRRLKNHGYCVYYLSNIPQDVLELLTEGAADMATYNDLEKLKAAFPGKKVAAMADKMFNQDNTLADTLIRKVRVAGIENPQNVGGTASRIEIAFGENMPTETLEASTAYYAKIGGKAVVEITTGEEVPVDCTGLAKLFAGTSFEEDGVKFTAAVDDNTVTYTSTTRTAVSGYAESISLYKDADCFEDMGLSGAVVSVSVGKADTTKAENLIAAIEDLRDHNDDWYFILTDVTDPVCVTALCKWAESTEPTEAALGAGVEDHRKFYFGQTNDKEYVNEYGRSVVTYADNLAEWADAAWVGSVGPFWPESVTWKWKVPDGVSVADLRDSERDLLEENRVNFMTAEYKHEYMKNGICGDGNFIDNVLGADYITHQIRENLYEIFIANKKIAYTDDGFALVAAGVFAALNRAVELHIIATDPEDDTGVYTVVIPKRADATDEQARNRQMPDIKWSAQLEGAVHSVKVNGTLRVTLNG